MFLAGAGSVALFNHSGETMADLPAMELEKLESTIENVKKLTTGIKTLMDGMSALEGQDLGPLLQPLRQSQPTE